MNPRKKKAAKPPKDPASKTGFMLRIEVGLLDKARTRAESLNQDVNQYIAALLRNDITKGGPLTLQPKLTEYVTPLQTPEEFIRGTPAKPETKYLPDEEKILSGEEGSEQGFAAEKKKRTGGSSS